MKRFSYPMQLEAARPLLEWLNDPHVNAGEKAPLVEFLLWNGRLKFRRPRKVTFGDHLKIDGAAAVLGGTVFKPKVVPTTILRGGKQYWQGRLHSEWVHLPEAGRNRASLAFLALTKLADQNLLGRVKVCANRPAKCGKWFLAKKDSEIYHEKRCRIAVNNAKPESREARREYMRKMRRDEKEADHQWQQASLKNQKGGKR